MPNRMVVFAIFSITGFLTAFLALAMPHVGGHGLLYHAVGAAAFIGGIVCLVYWARLRAQNPGRPTSS